MIKIKIYQINSERDTKRVMFESFKHMKMLAGSFDFSLYDCVYTGKVQNVDLEQIYAKFNVDRPNDFIGHSLSVSDIVEIEETKTKHKSYWFCDDFGFTELPAALIEKQRIFVDMDGTLAQFKTLDTLEPLFEKGYFEKLAPQQNVIDAVKEITQNHKDIEVYILSAYLSDSKYALDEKNKWLDKYIPEVDAKHRIFCPCGVDKKDYVIGGIRNNDFLLDDYTANLNLWQPPAKGIKILNGINNTKGSWQYDKLDFNKSPDILADNIVNIMHGKVSIKDEISDSKYIYIEVSEDQLSRLGKSEINFVSKDCDNKLIIQVASADVSKVEQLFGNRNNKTL